MTTATTARAATAGRLGNKEVEFLAEDELVTIVPRFEADVFEMIGGRFGPFVPQTPVQVPLWLAVELRKQQKCQIQCPSWMTVEELRDAKKHEKDLNQEGFKNLPSHYMEISSLLLRHGADDIENVNLVRSLLEDIEQLRQYRIRQGLHSMAAEQVVTVPHFVTMTNASAMEINSIRDVLLSSLERFYKMHGERDAAISSSNEIVPKVEALEEENQEEQNVSGFRRSNTAENNAGPVYQGNARIRRAQADRSQSQSQSQSQDDDGLVPLVSSMPATQTSYESDLDEDDIRAAMEQD